MKSMYIVIAAFNEQKQIAKVVKELHSKGYKHVIVVDDGSSDHTCHEAEKAGAFVLRHLINRGQGAALKTGIDYAYKQGADVIVTFDADGQHRPEDIKKMVDPVLKGLCDLTLGSRFLTNKSNVPPIKALALKAGAIFNWMLYGVKLSDAHNGFRALSRKAAAKIQITADKFEHASEILDEIRKKDLVFIEVPVSIRYTSYSMRKGQPAWKFIPLGFKMLFRKLMRLL